MSKDEEKNNDKSYATSCEDKALPPISSGARMPKVKPVAKPPTSTKKGK